VHKLPPPRLYESSDVRKSNEEDDADSERNGDVPELDGIIVWSCYARERSIVHPSPARKERQWQEDKGHKGERLHSLIRREVDRVENVVYKLIAIPHEKLETGKYRVCVIETILEVDAGGLTDEAKCRGVC